MRLKLVRSIVHEYQIFEQIRYLNLIPFGKLRELMLPLQESLSEVVLCEQIGLKHDLSKIRKCTDCGVRLEPLVEQPPHFETVWPGLRH